MSPAPLGLCLAGPTASGKSALALALAARLPVEIISVDSALVYRGMDIGTAKPSPAELAQVPHHLVDIIEPEQSYSAARFAREAEQLARDIRARGRVPLLVGGTMLYFKALRDGIDALPEADPALRAAIDAEAAEHGWPAMHARLAEVDPVTAARLKPNDAQRLQRAWEVYRASGIPLSTWHAQAKPAVDDADLRWPLWSLEPTQRAWLHDRIAERFDAMLAAGLVDEVRRLRQRPGLHPGLPSMRCVGYRQAWAALDAADLTDLRETGIAATRQLAKRQLTWLRSISGRSVHACDERDGAAQALTAMLHAAESALRRSPD